MKLCECGCGQEVKSRFIRGHQMRIVNTAPNPVWNKGRGKLAFLTKDELYALYYEKQLSTDQIAELFSVSNATICRKMQQFNIAARSHKGRLALVTKEELYDLYWIKRLTATQIGRMYKVRVNSIIDRMKALDIPRRTLADVTSGQYNPAWKGGRPKTGDGYVLIWINKDNPYYPMRNRKNYILEHRLVMAEHLNRCLEPWEVIHHINGIKNDNRIENLELLPRQCDHVPYMVLQERVMQLEKEVRLLKWQIKQLNTRLINTSSGDREAHAHPQ